MGVRFGFGLYISTDNANVITELLKDLEGLFDIKANGASNTLDLKNVKVDGKKIIMNAVIIGKLSSALCEADIEASLMINTTDTILEKTGEVRVIKDVAKEAYEAGELGDLNTPEGLAAAKELAKKYGYDPDATQAN